MSFDQYIVFLQSVYNMSMFVSTGACTGGSVTRGRLAARAPPASARRTAA